MTTVTRELLAAISALVLVLFVVFHLVGNLIIFWGAGIYNAYSFHLHSLGILLWVVRFFLLGALVVHVSLTVWLALLNRKARKRGYAVSNTMGGTDFAKRTMLYTGILILVFIGFHLRDFTLGNKEGAQTVINGLNGGQSLGLYGLVWNSFMNPYRSALYVLAMAVVGLHMSNALSTIWVTAGVLTDAATTRVNRAARSFSVLVAVLFSLIPVAILAATYLMGD